MAYQNGLKEEAILDRYFSRIFTKIQEVPREMQQKGADRIFGDNLLVDYKADHWTIKSNNMFVETISVDTIGKPGWCKTSTADVIVYIFPPTKFILIVPMSWIRGNLPRWERQYPTKPTRPILNNGYQTHGILVPVWEFFKYWTPILIE